MDLTNLWQLPLVKNPTTEDFDEFRNVLASRLGDNVWIHCAANMRVSAFIYKYRSVVLGESENLIKADLEKIWRLIGVWNEFILDQNKV